MVPRFLFIKRKQHPAAKKSHIAMMRNMYGLNSIVLAVSVVFAHALDSSIYDIQTRPEQRSRQLQQWADDIEDEAKISFDGNVAAIQALAMAKAAALSDGVNERDVDLAVPIMCDGTMTQTVFNLRFEYMVEYDPLYETATPGNRRILQSNSPLDQIIPQLENKMQEELAERILFCQAEDDVVIEAKVVGLVRTPRDEKLENRKYKVSETGRCSCMY